jgi:hypothetical protein
METGHRPQSLKLEEKELNLPVDILTNPPLSYEIMLRLPKLQLLMKILALFDATEKVEPRVL